MLARLDYNAVSDNAIRSMIGNAYSLNVVERLLCRALYCTRPPRKRKRARTKKVTVGSFCSGWDGVPVCLGSLSVPHTLRVACDSNQKVQKVLRAIFDHDEIYGDVSALDLRPSAT